MKIPQLFIFFILSASTVRPGSPPSTTTTLQTEAQTLPQGSLPSRTAASPATLPAAEEKPNQRAATKFTDTTVVIIVSVSLALLVCAVIPLIFYCRSNRDDQNGREANKGEADCGEDSAHDDSRYAAIYEALDPKGLD